MCKTGRGLGVTELHLQTRGSRERQAGFMNGLVSFCFPKNPNFGLTDSLPWSDPSLARFRIHTFALGCWGSGSRALAIYVSFTTFGTSAAGAGCYCGGDGACRVQSCWHADRRRPPHAAAVATHADRTRNQEHGEGISDLDADLQGRGGTGGLEAG